MLFLFISSVATPSFGTSGSPLRQPFALPQFYFTPLSLFLLLASLRILRLADLLQLCPSISSLNSPVPLARTVLCRDGHLQIAQGGKNLSLRSYGAVGGKGRQEKARRHYPCEIVRCQDTPLMMLTKLIQARRCSRCRDRRRMFREIPHPPSVPLR